MTILDEEEFVASAVVYPSSTPEVQKIVHWANKYSIPIFPISMGRNRTSISGKRCAMVLLSTNTNMFDCEKSAMEELHQGYEAQ